MKRIATFAVVLVLSLAACKKKEGDKPAEPAKPTEPAKPAPPPPPFAGKLTIDRVLAAKGVVDPMAPWADAIAKLKGQLGEPTRAKDGKYEWAVVEGDDCAYTYVTKIDGATIEKAQMKGELVGEVMTPMKVGKDGPSMNRSQCLEITGVTAGPPEDPNAAAPPSDGSAVPADAFRTNAIAGRSKWKDQKVVVSGVFGGATVSTSGADSWTTVNVKAGKDDAGKPIGCSLAKNAPAVTFGADEAITATGTVVIREWTSMGSGGTTLEAALTDCTLAKAK